MSATQNKTMIFNDNQPIYLQILELINYKIMNEEWMPDERIPSVRDMAVAYEVNPNTVMRAYDILQNGEIIFKRRGVGYYLASDAREKTVVQSKNEFISNDLPKLFAKLDTFAITLSELEDIYSKYKASKED